jgi:uncharacterized protein YjbI with pentapeptide repeats
MGRFPLGGFASVDPFGLTYFSEARLGNKGKNSTPLNFDGTNFVGTNFVGTNFVGATFDAAAACPYRPGWAWPRVWAQN